MKKSKPPLPRRIELFWGCDRLYVEDPIWIEKIMSEVVEDRDEHIFHPCEPRSFQDEEICAGIVSQGFSSFHYDPPSPDRLSGYQPTDHQDGIAGLALKEFLGLELPLALNFTHYSGRSEHRMSAVNVFFRRRWSYGLDTHPQIEWAFMGYQLYASHHISRAYYRPYGTDGMGHIEKRNILTGKWNRWGFDGASSPPPGREWSTNHRFFILSNEGVKRTGQNDSDLSPEDDGN